MLELVLLLELLLELLALPDPVLVLFVLFELAAALLTISFFAPINKIIFDIIPLDQLVHGDAVFIGNQPNGITGFHRVSLTSRSGSTAAQYYCY